MRKGPNDEPLVGGYEYDRLTRAKRYHKFGPGVGKYIKRHFWRRVRRKRLLELRREIGDYDSFGRLGRYTPILGAGICEMGGEQNGAE
jgi:hypothetical protein